MAISFTTSIADTAEKALQRAMFILGSFQRGSDEIEWLDMELPVDLGKTERFDLIGRSKKAKRFVLCEVKFCRRTTHSDNPQYAANEAVKYYKHIKENYTTYRDNHHSVPNPDGFVGKVFDWDLVAHNNTELIVVANAAYWAYWLGHMKVPVPLFGECEGFRKRVICFSVDVPGDYFDRLKDGRKVYIPTVDSLAPIVLKA